MYVCSSTIDLVFSIGKLHAIMCVGCCMQGHYGELSQSVVNH